MKILVMNSVDGVWRLHHVCHILHSQPSMISSYLLVQCEMIPANVKTGKPDWLRMNLILNIWSALFSLVENNVHIFYKKFNHEKSRLYVFNSGLNGDAGYQLWTKCTMQETNYDFFHEVQNYGCGNVVHK